MFFDAREIKFRGMFYKRDRMNRITSLQNHSLAKWWQSFLTFCLKCCFDAAIKILFLYGTRAISSRSIQLIAGAIQRMGKQKSETANSWFHPLKNIRLLLQQRKSNASFCLRFWSNAKYTNWWRKKKYFSSVSPTTFLCYKLKLLLKLGGELKVMAYLMYIITTNTVHFIFMRLTWPTTHTK